MDFALKMLHWDDNSLVRLQLWDVAGQERFHNLTRVYYKDAFAAVVVFDLTSRASFNDVLKWKTDLDSKVRLPPDDRPIPVILLGNKSDLVEERDTLSDQEMTQYCQDHGFCGYFETSAKTGDGIDKAFMFLVKEIFKNDSSRDAQLQSAGPAVKLSPGQNVQAPASQSCCS